MSIQGVIVDFEQRKTEIRFGRLVELLLTFSKDSKYGDVVTNGFRRFVEEASGETALDEDAIDFGAIEDEFLEWVMLDYEDDSIGTSIARAFLDSIDEGDLPDWEKRALSQWTRSTLALYEIESIVSENHVVLRDVVLGGEYDVIAEGAGVGMVRWTPMLTRLLSVDGGYAMGATAMPMPRPLLRYVLKVLGHVFRSARAQGYIGGWQGFLKMSGASLRRLVRVVMGVWDVDGDSDGPDEDGPTEVREAGAEKLYRSRVVVSDPDEARAAVSSMNEVRLLGEQAGQGGRTETHYAWLRPASSAEFSGAAPYSVDDAALMVFDGEAFIVYAQSRSALGSCRNLLRKSLGGNVAAREAGARGTERRQKRPSREAMEMAREAIDGIIREALEAHYGIWADTPLPALLGESPRGAVASGLGRKVVEDLLKDIEYLESLKRRAGMPSLDVERLWRQVLDGGSSRDTAGSQCGAEDANSAACGLLGPKENSVAKLLDEMMRQDGYTEDQIFATAKMWSDYVAAAKPNVVHASTWAASVEYASAVARKEQVTQASVALKYQVSVSTLSQRYRQILDTLNI